MVWFQDTQDRNKFEFGILNLENARSCAECALPSSRCVEPKRRNSRAENIFSQMIMNSFSTVFKRRGITLLIAILCAIAIIGAIGMRAYSVLQR